MSGLNRASPSSDELRAGADEPGIDRHRPLGRLAEVEALAEVDGEVAHRLELADALDALGHDARLALVRALDERSHEAAAAGRVLDPGRELVVDLGEVRLERLEVGERVGPA